MDSNFDHFLDSLVNVPPELERNFTLIRELDERTKEVMGRVQECIVQYEVSKSHSDRKRIREKTDSLFTKINSYGEDKYQLSLQTYELIDKNIKRLVSLGNSTLEVDSEHANSEQPKPLGYDMPLDEHEPRYCICKNISHGEMIACENKECETEWFHFGCVGITKAPKGKWYCGNCLPQIKARHRNASKRRRR